MNKFLLLLLVYALLSGCCTISQLVTRAPKNSEFVGNIHLGNGVSSSESTKIPISFSGGAWAQNSALVPCQIYSELRGQKIMLQVNTCTASESSCFYNKHIQLSGLESGQYQLIYLEPNGTETAIGTYNTQAE